MEEDKIILLVSKIIDAAMSEADIYIKKKSDPCGNDILCIRAPSITGYGLCQNNMFSIVRYNEEIFNSLHPDDSNYKNILEKSFYALWFNNVCIDLKKEQFDSLFYGGIRKMNLLRSNIMDSKRKKDKEILNELLREYIK